MDLEWHTSSFCNNSACVGVSWRKSSKSNPSGNSVEFLNDPCQDVLYVQDSKNPGAVQVYARDKWHAGLAVHFQAIMKSELPDGYNLGENADSVSWFRVDHYGLLANGEAGRVVFYYDVEERNAYLRGVVAREFASV